jgi:hypothetical protein
MVTPFLFRHSMYAANALLPPPFWPFPLVDVVAESSEPPPQAAVSSTAADATNRASVRRGAFELTLGTMFSFPPMMGRPTEARGPSREVGLT